MFWREDEELPSEAGSAQCSRLSPQCSLVAGVGLGRVPQALLGFISAALESKEPVGWCTVLAAWGREEGMETRRKAARYSSTRAVGTNAINNINVVYCVFI